MSEQDIQTAARALLDAGLTGSGDEARHWATIATASLTAENERLRAALAISERDLAISRSKRYDLEAEVERLRALAAELRERVAGERLRADINSRHLAERARAAEAALSSLRELESAARAWRACHGIPDVPSKQLHGAIRTLIAAVDALPPTPPATEDSDV